MRFEILLLNHLLHFYLHLRHRSSTNSRSFSPLPVFLATPSIIVLLLLMFLSWTSLAKGKWTQLTIIAYHYWFAARSNLAEFATRSMSLTVMWMTAEVECIYSKDAETQECEWQLKWNLSSRKTQRRTCYVKPRQNAPRSHDILLTAGVGNEGTTLLFSFSVYLIIIGCIFFFSYSVLQDGMSVPTSALTLWPLTISRLGYLVTVHYVCESR